MYWPAAMGHSAPLFTLRALPSWSHHRCHLWAFAMAAGDLVYSPFTHGKLVPSLTLHPQTQFFTTSCGIHSVSGFIFKESEMMQTLSRSWEDPEDTSDEDMEAAMATSSVTGGDRPP